MPLRVLAGVDLAKLQEQFRDDILDTFGQSTYSWNMAYGWRSWDEQNELYEKYLAGGPLAAKPGTSAHEWGLAVDLQLVGKDGSLVWSISAPGWLWLKAKVLAHPRLHSLWSLGDYDHVERYHWWNFK